MNDLVNAFSKRKESKIKHAQPKHNFPKNTKIDVPKGLYEKCPSANRRIAA